MTQPQPIENSRNKMHISKDTVVNELHSVGFTSMLIEVSLSIGMLGSVYLMAFEIGFWLEACSSAII